MLRQLEEYFNNRMKSWFDELLQEESTFKFHFRPVLINQEKRGHFSTSTLLKYIQELNKYYEGNQNKHINLASAIAFVVKKLNDLLAEKDEVPEDHVLRKISHFTEKNGVVSGFFSDKQAIEELIESTKEMIYSDEELSEHVTEDPELLQEESQESDMDDDAEIPSPDGATLGVVESVFREVHGLPTSIGFVPKAIAKIHLNDSKFDSVLEKVGDSRYIWIQHIFHNSWEWQGISLKDELKASSQNSEISLERCSTWSLAQVDKVEGKIIWISGAKILHNTSIFGIESFKTKPFLELLKDVPKIDYFSSNLLEKISLNCSDDLSPEDIVNEEIEKFYPKMKSITYSESVLKELKGIVEQGKLDFYSTTDEAISALNLVLSMEPIWILTQTKILLKNIYAVAFDNLMVIYEKWGECIQVVKLVWSTHFIETGTQHTKEWLDTFSTVLGLERLLTSN